MSMDPLLIEKALLLSTWDEQPIDDQHPIAALANAAVRGSFKDVLTSSVARKFFRTGTDTLDQPFEKYLESLTSPTTPYPEDETSRLILGVACLHAFVQETGRALILTYNPRMSCRSPQPLRKGNSIKLISELACGGEPAYHLMRSAGFLWLARAIFTQPYSHSPTIAWWRIRTALVHQQVLDEPVALPDNVLNSLDPSSLPFATEPAIAGRLMLEKGLFEHHFSHDKAAAEYFVRAARSTGLEYELTGALGKRTKFQEMELSQLVLLAESHLGKDTDGEGITPDSDNVSPDVPQTLELNDDTLLEQTEFTSSKPLSDGSRLGHLNPSSQPALHPLDQCILLSLCLNVKNTSPSHGLTSEQMSPYIARVISHPRNWSVHTMALLLRSRLESSRTRTVERSTLQLQALIDQMPTGDSPLSERLLYFHSIPLPSKWEMERELALRFLSIGVIKSALEIFERLEMWEEVVRCWGSLERPEKAIAIVRDLLEGRISEAENTLSLGKITSADRRRTLDRTREAKLWCLLGDLEPENAVKHYEHAWAISNETSGRAMRSLGGYYFARGKYSQAISCLKRAVAINPLLSRSWFILGCACMREENWEEAKNAFSRCVFIDEEDGESWNNLASMYLRMGAPKKQASKSEDEDDQADRKDKDLAMGFGDQVARSIPFSNKMLAFRALKQGLRFSYENWRMWYNYMIIAMDVGELSEASRALGRIIEETSAKVGAQSVDEDVLERLVDAVTRAPANPEDAVEGGKTQAAVMNPNEGHGLLRNVSSLFERTILPRVSSPRIFRAYARLLTWQSRWEAALKAYLDGYRCSTAGTMEKGETDAGRWREGVREVEEIVDILRNFGPRVDDYKWRLQGRSIVRTFIGRTKDFEDEPEWTVLTELQNDLRKEESE
ncbi:hypothetical protein BD779DRAFT_1673513 [Infundibulicybe gibba]|nr:hypothetical protein BD779DRAFT_1673513 [Infundibulicybe gibba]